MPTRKAWCQPHLRHSPLWIEGLAIAPRSVNLMAFPLQEAGKSIGLAQDKAREFLGQMPGISITWLPSLKRPRVLSLAPQTVVQVHSLFKTFLPWIFICHCLSLVLSCISHACQFLCPCACLVPAFWLRGPSGTGLALSSGGPIYIALLLPLTYLHPLTNTSSLQPLTEFSVSFWFHFPVGQSGECQYPLPVHCEQPVLWARS